MSSSTSQIIVSIRTPSKAAFLARELRLQESRSELKRKWSTVSFEDDPIRHTKLKIEGLEVEIEEQKLHKSWLDLEREESKTVHSEYLANHKTVNSRIVSLGNELWSKNQALRQEEEKAGKSPALGPDSRGSFVQTLLRLYKDPNEIKKRSSRIQTTMKDKSIVVYEAGKGAPEGKLWCPISRDYFNKRDVRAGHIVPYSIGPELTDYLFGNGSGSRLNSPDNCLFMHHSVETAFDAGHFVLLPANADEMPIKRWIIQPTNSAALNTDMGRVTLQKLQGQEVIFMNEHRPAARFLYYHFVVTLLRNQRYRQPGWEKFLVKLPTKKPFAAMGKYLRESMLLQLAKMAGDLDTYREARLLGEVGQAVFTDQEKLNEREEAEVARRVYQAHDDTEKDEDDVDDDSDDDDGYGRS